VKPILFAFLIIWYKAAYRLPMVVVSNVAQRFPAVEDDPLYPTLWEPGNIALRRVIRVLRFIR